MNEIELLIHRLTNIHRELARECCTLKKELADSQFYGKVQHGARVQSEADLSSALNQLRRVTQDATEPKAENERLRAEVVAIREAHGKLIGEVWELNNVKANYEKENAALKDRLSPLQTGGAERKLAKAVERLLHDYYNASR